MDPQTINIGKDFHPAPAGRTPDDGPYSGEAFRKRMLLPALGNSSVVVVELGDLEGYGSSFLEEAFGGIVRDGKFTAHQLHDKLRLQSKNDPSVVAEIWSYIDEAKPTR